MDAKISVVIPLYNAEKYIVDCLESLLAQTFADFEVIVVDDRSTDSSPSIVESYREKFNGRLTLSHTETNTGSGALPRNKGMMLSRGEYVFFMDADDMFTKTALEELYALAKNFDADLVLTEKNYQMNSDGTNLKIYFDPTCKPVEVPTLEATDLARRVQMIINLNCRVEPWCKLVRRSLIFEHEIFFPHTRISEDTIWSWGLTLYAKKFLRVPNVVYIWRKVGDSISHVEKSPQQTINFWLNPVLLGLKSLDKFMSRLEFFRQNPQHRYAVLEKFIFVESLAYINASFQLQPFEVFETLKQEFGDKLGDNDVLICALCTAFNTQQKITALNQQRFNQFAAQAQQRIAELEAEVKRLKSSVHKEA